jgi:hypothetical protein
MYPALQAKLAPQVLQDTQALQAQLAQQVLDLQVLLEILVQLEPQV